MIWDDVATLREVCARGAAVRVRGLFEVHPRWGAQLKLRAIAAAEPGSYDLAELLDGPPRDADAMEQDLRDLRRHGPEPPPARAARRAARRGHRDVGALPRRARRQALPPGLRARPARALPVGRAVGQRDQRDVPRHRPRRRGHRRAAARHRQARGLHRRPRGDRPDRRRPAAGRDPARLLPRAARDRGDPRLPDRARPGGHAHHPQPPRRARARQPGRPRDARGHARAHDRQPRRPARAASTGSRRSCAGRALVGLRPRARRRRVLRAGPAQPESAPRPDATGSGGRTSPRSLA